MRGAGMQVCGECGIGMSWWYVHDGARVCGDGDGARRGAGMCVVNGGGRVCVWCTAEGAAFRGGRRGIL